MTTRNAPLAVTADNLTDEQINTLWHEESNHAVTVVCRRALAVDAARRECEEACRRIAEELPTGLSIEHLNHKLLECGLALGRALIARRQCADAINAIAKVVR